jgi:hypothetical protein
MSDSPTRTVHTGSGPQFRWVAPLFIGLSAGAVVGIIVTFVAVSGRSSSSMMVQKFDIQRALGQAGSEGLSMTQDSSVNLGRDSYNPVDGGTSVRRRIELSGVIRDPADASNLANRLKAQIDAEIARHGVYTSGGGSSFLSSGKESRFTAESSFYKGNNRGQVDIVFHANDRQVHVIILIHEGR